MSDLRYYHYGRSTSKSTTYVARSSKSRRSSLVNGNARTRAWNCRCPAQCRGNTGPFLSVGSIRQRSRSLCRS